MGLESTGRRSRYDLSDLGFMDDSRIPEMDMICDLAARASNSPMSVMVVGDDVAGRQRLKGVFGVGDSTLKKARIVTGSSLIGRVREATRVVSYTAPPQDGISPEDLAVFHAISFLGAPVYGPAGEPIGAVALYDHMPRTWRSEDYKVVRAAADLASKQVMMRAALATLKIMAQTSETEIPILPH